MPAKTSVARRFRSFLGSQYFFRVIVGLLVLQAGWIALTARYPQAFDEQFHFGLIQLHAQHWWPYLTQQYNTNGVYGPLTRDPSYMYHYIMSFPYRLIAQFTHDLTIQVIALRFINIGFMVAALYVLRRVLAYTRASRALIQTCLFFFVMTPVVPLLASQINYDNLLVLLTGLTTWWSLRFLRDLRVQRIWRWDILVELVIMCLFASLVKYAFLPILVAIAVCLVAAAWTGRHLVHIKNPLRVLPGFRLAVYCLLIVAAAGLFGERYGINVVRYHTPTPSCNQVLTIDACQQYAPWARNYYNAQHKTTLTTAQEIAYPLSWVKHSISELVFAIGSGYNQAGLVDYYVGTQLPIPNTLGWIFFVGGIVLACMYYRELWRNQTLRLLSIICLLYALALLLQNWHDYLSVGQLVAIHGRYLVPLLPFLYVMLALGIRRLIQRTTFTGATHLRMQAATVLALGILMTQGGGITTYLVRSDFWWFWPQSNAAMHANSDAKAFLKPLVIGV